MILEVSIGEGFNASYTFRKPTVQIFSRMAKQGQQQDGFRASQTLLMACVDDADKDKLMLDIEEYPGIVTSLAANLLESVGATAEVTVKN